MLQIGAIALYQLGTFADWSHGGESGDSAARTVAGQCLFSNIHLIFEDMDIIISSFLCNVSCLFVRRSCLDLENVRTGCRYHLVVDFTDASCLKPC